MFREEPGTWDTIKPDPDPSTVDPGDWSPSTKWDRGGPIIEAVRIRLLPSRAFADEWLANAGAHAVIAGRHMFLEENGSGSTALVAAMRAYVASKFGGEVPDPS